jgi:two-component system, NarL family, response regulator YdfI
MIRVLIKAPTPVATAGLASLIRSYPSLEVMGAPADQPGSLQTVVTDLYPDVIVAQIESENDLQFQELLDEATSGTPVIVLVRSPSVRWGAMFRHGIRGALPGDASGEQIAAAIEAAAAGLIVFHANEADRLFEPPLSGQESPDSLPEALTVREIEILRCLAEGLGNKEIASRLRISEHTVKFHVASIMGKLGVGNRTEAVMSGIRHGLVPI